MTFLIGTGIIVLNLFSSIVLSERYLGGGREDVDKTRRFELIFDRSATIITVFAIMIASYIVFRD